MADLNRRLLLGSDIVYPITKQENVINLQKTIKEKLPIISNTQPSTNITRQVWIDTSAGQELSFSNEINEELTFEEE